MFVNLLSKVKSDRLFLGVFFLLTIGSAILVGYLYAGKSWCHYFCPMAPVEMIFNGPRGLLGSQAHQGKIERSGLSRIFAGRVGEKKCCSSR